MNYLQFNLQIVHHKSNNKILKSVPYLTKTCVKCGTLYWYGMAGGFNGSFALGREFTDGPQFSRSAGVGWGCAHYKIVTMILICLHLISIS